MSLLKHKKRKSSREVASVFVLPSCCSFWLPVMRGTGEFLKGWPRFTPLCHGLFDPAGGTVEAQSVNLMAPPVRCCMGDRLRIPMTVFFLYHLSLSLLFSSTVLFYSFPLLIFILLSLPPHPPVFVLRCSYSLSACLFLCLSSFPRCLCRCLSRELSAAAAAGLSCAVICHTTEGKTETSFIDALFSLSFLFCVSLSQAIWFLPSSQLLSLLLSYLFYIPPLASFPGGLCFPKTSGSYPTWGWTFQKAVLFSVTWWDLYLTLTSRLCISLWSRTWHWGLAGLHPPIRCLGLHHV